MENSLRILIVGTDYEPNFGDQAIFATMVQNLRRTIPRVNLTVHSQQPDRTHTLIGKYLAPGDVIRRAVVNAESARELNAGILSPKALIQAFDNELSSLPNRVDVTEIETSDAILLVGGGSKISEHEKDTVFNLLYLALGKRYCKPVVLYLQSVSRPVTRRFKLLRRSVLNQTDLILLRENFSKRILEKDGVRKELLVTGPDSAFYLVPEENISEVLEKEAIRKKSGPLIGICAGSRSDAYSAAMAVLADYLIAELGAHIVFIHTRGDMSPGFPNDKETSRQIARHMRHRQVSIIERDYDCEILAGIIRQFDLLIGLRMHALIFALVNGVPVVPISMYYKTRGVLSSVSYPFRDIAARKVTARKLIRLTSVIWKEREGISKQLFDRIPVLRSEIEERFQLIEKVIMEHRSLTTGSASCHATES